MPKFPHNTKFYCKKSIFALSLFLLFSFLPVPKANATVWPGIDPIIKTGLDQIRSMINNLIVGVMKQAAVSMLNTQINSLVSQETNGQSAFITDWEDYLIDRPLHNTAVHMNDYISEMTRGRNSYSGYSGEGFAGNYSADLGSYSRDMLEGGNDTPQVTYEGEPSKMFQNGSLKDMESYFSFSAPNNSWLFDIAVEKENQKYSQKETLKAQTKSVAYQGFNGTSAGDGDQISYPGSLAKEAVANAENIPNTILATAKDIPEVVTSIITQMITRSIQQGFSGVQKNIQKNVRDVENKVNSSINKTMRESGPGSRY